MEQLYPFSKNRYFRKKRMRAVDFERDQAFADHKLSFLSHWVFGTGVAFGLGVQRIDSDSLLVEPGLAIDAQGRFLIVDEPTICRVRALPGFEALQSENALLWLSYKEELLDPMFVADDEGQSTQYAVAKERFELSLSEEGLLPMPAADEALLSETVLFEDEEIRVSQSIPRVLSATHPFHLRLYIQCFSLEPLDLELTYAPDIPGFTGEDGKELRFQERLRAQKGETVLNLTVLPAQPAQMVRITVPETGLSVEKRGMRHNGQCAYQEEFAVVPGDVFAAMAERLNARSPQELWDDQPLGVPLAGVRFVRYDDKALLDDILPLGTRHQASVPCLQDRLQRVAARFLAVEDRDTPEKNRPCPKSGTQAQPEAPTSTPRQMTTGSVMVNAGLHMKAGSILTTEEIEHGLGPGTVFIEFGIEHIYPVANSVQNRTDLLLGDVSLFDQASGTYDKDFDRGVRVHPDKGTFELAIRPLADLRQSNIWLRWFAWRPDGAAPKAETGGILKRLHPDVIHVKPGEAISFTPIFTNGATLPCDFFVEGKQAGVITRDGIYTAPEREGLYQIYAQVRGNPEERANAFVIVKAEEVPDGPGGV